MIGVVTTSYPRHAGDWAGAFVLDRVRVLVQAGSTVEVVAASPDDGSVREWHEPGVRVIRVPAPASLFYGAGAPDALEAGGWGLIGPAGVFTARLASVVTGRAQRWDSVESHWLAPSALVVSATVQRRSHQAFAHGGDVALLERLPGGAALARWIVRSGARLSFVSADLRARFARLAGLDPAAFAVEAAPVDSMSFSRRTPHAQREARAALGCCGLMIFTAGRLVPIKGFDTLIRALSRLPAKRRPRLVIAGEGPERALLARLARERGVVLDLLGTVERATVARWMIATDLYVQPSGVLPSGRSEGMPVAVREALAVGVPVVATDAGGQRELAERGATLVCAGDLTALAAAIDAQLLTLTAQPNTHLLDERCEVGDAHPPRHSM